MGLFDVMQFSVVLFPETYLSTLAGTCKDLFFEGMPLHNEHRIFMSLELLDFLFHIPEIKQLYLLVFWACKQVYAIDRVPPCLLHCRIMSLMLKDTFASIIPWVPNTNSLVFAASHNQWLERMPIAGGAVRVVLLESWFTLWGCEVPHLSRPVVTATHKLNGTQWEWKVSHTTVEMSLELILLVDHLIAIHNISLLVTCNQKLLVVAPNHSLNSIAMHITTILILQVLCIPHNDLSLTWATDHFLAVLHPLDLIQRSLMLVLALA